MNNLCDISRKQHVHRVYNKPYLTFDQSSIVPGVITTHSLLSSYCLWNSPHSPQKTPNLFRRINILWARWKVQVLKKTLSRDYTFVSRRSPCGSCIYCNFQRAVERSVKNGKKIKVPLPGIRWTIYRFFFWFSMDNNSYFWMSCSHNFTNKNGG